MTRRSPKVADYQYLVEKVKLKLSNWNRNQLSMTGRITLAKSVLESTPTYTTMSSMIPKICLKNIQMSRRNFMWGDNDGAGVFTL